MVRVTGIGGVFFAADDPEALTRWYAECLAITPPPADYESPEWQQEAGPTVFAAMSRDSGHVVARGWSINLRVDDLDEMVVHLQGKGIEVRVDDETYPNGRFAELNDPEGNPIQLWQPIKGPGLDR